jgi:hypothetical protein
MMLRLWLAIAFLLGVFCADFTSISQGGGASETTSARVRIVDTSAYISLDTAGTRFSVHVYDAAYRPYEELGYTDSLSDTGTLVWRAPAAGSYNFILSSASDLSAFVPGVSMANGARDTVVCKLKSSHVFAGSFKQRSPALTPDTLVMYIAGSPYVAVIESSQQFMINNLPSGRYTVSVRPMSRFFFSTHDYLIDTDSLKNNAFVSLEIP